MFGLWFSDTHLYWWSKYNKGGRRLQGQMDIVEYIFKEAYTRKVPLFFGGDIFHSPVGVSNSLLSMVLPWLIELFNVYPIEVYAISGNHDIEGINNKAHRSPSYINTLANSIKGFHNLDFETVEFEKFAVHGVPYITHNVGYEEIIRDIKIIPGKYNILMNHGDYKGQKDTNGIIIGKGENVNEEDLKKFDLVMSGHVHKPGKIRGNINSIGAQCQMRLSDMGGSFGYWSLKKRFRLAFKEIDWAPKYRLYSSEKDKDNDTDFWVKEAKADEEINEMLEEEMDFQDKVNIGKQYLSVNKIKSRSKRALLVRILQETEDSDD